MVISDRSHCIQSMKQDTERRRNWTVYIVVSLYGGYVIESRKLTVVSEAMIE